MKHAFTIIVFAALSGSGNLASVADQPHPSSTAGDSAAGDDAVTFNEHVAPIIFDKCANCHHPGQGAPFNLTTYDEVRKRARLIAVVTENRFMPPWHAERADVQFKHERRLDDAEITMLRRWAISGAPEGAKPAPSLPKFAKGWVLGEPDLILTMPEPFIVYADGPDIYRSFAIPTGLEHDRWIRAIEYRAGTRSVVHHCFFFCDPTGNSHAIEEVDGQPGFEKMSNAIWQNSLGGWNFGGDPVTVPEGMAYRLPKGSDFILQTHFHPTGKEEREISSVGIHFADGPPTRSFTSLMFPPIFGMFAGIDIPAGSNDYTVTDQFVLPVDVHAFGVTAHAHYLGKEIRMTAELPNGEQKRILWIKDWDFSWQEQYTFEEFLMLPQGTRLRVSVRYDNTAENPLNPAHPPRRVRWGRGSEDEMGCVTLNVSPVDQGDLQTLSAAYEDHLDNSFLEVALKSKNGSAMIRNMFRRMDKNKDGEFSDDEKRTIKAFLKRNGLWAKLPGFQPRE